MPMRWPTTVAADEPVMPQPNHWMNTMSRQRFATLSMMTARETNFGLPSTPTIVDSPHMRMKAGLPNNNIFM